MVLARYGNHARGTIFEDGASLMTDALRQNVDEVATAIPDFYIGRFDIRYENLASFQKGEKWKLIEVNGAGAEATHIYDANISIGEAYRVLAKQWDHVFSIGRINQKNAKRGDRLRDLFREMFRSFRQAHQK